MTATLILYADLTAGLVNTDLHALYDMTGRTVVLLAQMLTQLQFVSQYSVSKLQIKLTLCWTTLDSTLKWNLQFHIISNFKLAIISKLQHIKVKWQTVSDRLVHWTSHSAQPMDRSSELSADSETNERIKQLAAIIHHMQVIQELTSDRASSRSTDPTIHPAY